MILETDHLTKLYQQKVGCRDICLSVPEGQIFGFLGPNGAGKSTLVKTLVGLLFPTSGTAHLLGRPLGDLEARKKIGFLPENFRYPAWLTGYELLSFHATLHRLPPARKKQRIEEMFALVGLTGKERQKVATYSKGMQQRLGLACTLVPDPDLVFLDEPTSALDPLGRREVRAIILKLKQAGKTVFLNSHLLSEVEMICDRVAIIKQGTIVTEGALTTLLDSGTKLEMEIGNLTPALARTLAELTTSLNISDTRIIATVRHRDDIPRLAATVTATGGQLYSLVAHHRSLEDVFVDLVREDD
jgi:ABC-2 type transport system ATP-binding protein